VDIGDKQVRVVEESVKDSVSMMGVDVDIGDTPDAVPTAERFNGNANVIEDTEAGGTVSSGVMQAGDGYEAATRGTRQRLSHRIQHGSDDMASRLI
jgi:hypothetical protein